MSDPHSSAKASDGAAGTQASKYRTAPDKNHTGMPPGVPYIVGNEAAERFSFYGMRSILIIFMTTYLMNTSGQLAVMSENEATGWFHEFGFRGISSPDFRCDHFRWILGKYRTIISYRSFTVSATSH